MSHAKRVSTVVMAAKVFRTVMAQDKWFRTFSTTS